MKLEMDSLATTHELIEKSYPSLLEIEPARGCNLRCIMCHVPQNKEKAQFLDIDTLEKNTRNLRDCHVIIGSEYEPTIHPEFNKLLKLSVKRGWKVDFLTNGTNLHKIEPSLLADVQFNVFNVSFDGFDKKSFEFIRRGAKYHTILENIQRASSIVRENGAYTAVNATVMRSNLNETTDLIRMWDQEGFDLVRLLLVQLRATHENLYSESLYPVLANIKSTLDEVANILSQDSLKIGVRCGYYGTKDFTPPDRVSVKEATIYSDNREYRHVPGVRQDVQSGSWPGMSWKCKSPFVYARIRWDGIVDLCNNRKFNIGSIYENSFDDIWNGNNATKQRHNITKNNAICKNCDYFRYCINIRNLPLNEPQTHFAAGIFNHPNTTLQLKKWSLKSAK